MDAYPYLCSRCGAVGAKGVPMEQKIGESFYEELERRRSAEPQIFPRLIVPSEKQPEDELRSEDYEVEQRR